MLNLRATLFTALLVAPVAAQAEPPNPSFNLVNHGAAAVSAFFATPAGRANWGRDRLEGKGVTAGGKAAVRLPADGNCVYDLRAVFAGGREEVQREINVCKVDDVTVGEALPRGLRLHNLGSVPVTEVQVRPAGAGHAATNLTAGQPIAPGAEGKYDLPGTDCVFDLRVTFEGGKIRQKPNADLCKSPDQGVQ